MKTHHSITQLFGYELRNLRKRHPSLEYHYKDFAEKFGY